MPKAAGVADSARRPAVLVAEQWLALVRTAALLLRDGSVAEDVVGDVAVSCVKRRELITDQAQL